MARTGIAGLAVRSGACVGATQGSWRYWRSGEWANSGGGSSETIGLVVRAERLVTIAPVFEIDDAENPWRVVKRRTAYRNPYSVLKEDHLEGRRDGRQGIYGYFAAVDWVLVVALDKQRRVHLVRQWRYAWDKASWEVVCGRVEKGERPLDTARRELAEEAGQSSQDWTELGTVQPSDARCAGSGHVFLARGCAPLKVRPAHDATEFDLRTESVPLADALAAVEDGRIDNVASAMALLRVGRLLGV